MVEVHHLGGSAGSFSRDHGHGNKSHGQVRHELPSPSPPSVPDLQGSSGKSGPDKFDDDTVVLSSYHAERAARFRKELRLFKTGPRGYELCLRMRNELLTEHTGVKLLAAACEHVMSSQCAEYKDWKETRNKPTIEPTIEPTIPKDDIAEWDRFLQVANDGLEINPNASPL